MKLGYKEQIEEQKSKLKKIKTFIIVLLTLFVILCAIIGYLVVYNIQHPSKITTTIDGVAIKDFDSILDFVTDENGKTQIYIPIREFADYLNAVNPEFGYQTFKGNYNPKTEEDDKCYVIRDKYEVSLYIKKTKTIYRLNLQTNSNEYEEYYIDNDIFENNGKLYTSVEGIEKGYNVDFSYDENKKTIKIYTLDSIINAHQKALEGKTVGNFGTLSIKENSYTDNKAVFDNLLIVKASSNQKCGIVKANDYSSFILEPQYDKINYISDSETFLVQSDGKVGMFSKDGKRKIDLNYEQITSMGQNSDLYLVKSKNTYGVVDGNGKIVIYPEYEKIGLDVNSYSYNGVKNGYILLNKLIPVYQNKKWAFFNKKGEMVTNGFIYTEIGCSSMRNVNNVYPVLIIPDYNVVVVKDEYDKYGFMDTTGNDLLLQFVFDDVYIKISSGETYYCMTFNEKEYDVLKNLQKVIQN